MIEIKFQGDSLAQIQAKMKAFFSADPSVQELEAAQTAFPPTHMGQAAATEKRKPGRPPKAPQPTRPEEMNGSGQLAAAPPVAPPAPAAAVKEPTLEETKHAVNRVLESKGVKVAHECIKHFGANRITELAKDKWQALIEHCNGVLA